MTGWKLVLAGGLDTKSMPHALYFEKITTEAKGWNIEVAPNVDRKKLDNLFQQSAFYVHAAGLGQNEDLHPENFEHFGITVLEATLSGCIPIVYNVAGPAEIVGRLGGGYTYDSESSMYQVLLNMMQKAGEPGTINYLFLGDYVDRGILGIEVVLFLFSLKLCEPKSVVLLRGNHESRNMTESFTFREEVLD